jgi:hypothetical protein
MARVSSNDFLDTGTWEHEEDPGAGAQSFDETGAAGTGLNGNWIRFWKALKSILQNYGVLKDDLIDGNALKASVADGVGIETTAGSGTKSLRLKDGGVTEQKIATGAVTETKIATAAVTNAKIANGAVDSNKLANAAVTNAKLAANAVTNDKIPDSAISPSKFAFKQFVAKISQSGTLPPTVAIISNTLGGTVVWSRMGTGYYRGTLAGAFGTNSAIVFVTKGLGAGFAFGLAGGDTVDIYSFNGAGALSDDILSGGSLLIQVY